jgi:hypothetical protein
MEVGMVLTGVAHVHSTYSYDGRHPLPEIVAFLRARGLHFVLMSEHARGLGPNEMARFVAECDALSDDRFVVVPGVECEAKPDYVHVLGYNVRAVIPAGDLSEIVGSVRGQGGVAVLAHPGYRAAYAHVAEDALGLLHGLEVWNGKADGRWLPNAESMARLSALRASHTHLIPLAGADLHRLESYPEITLRVTCPALRGEALAAGIAQGEFEVIGAGFRFRGREPLRVPPGRLVSVMAGVTGQLKGWARRVDRGLATRGLRIPEPVSRLARRLLR